jgi:hypothetical protein
MIEEHLYTLVVDLIGGKMVAKKNRNIIYREKGKRVTDKPTYYDASKDRGPSEKSEGKN